MPRRVTILLFGWAAARAPTFLNEEAELVDAALASDDQCATGDTQCSLHALQLRAQKQSAVVDGNESAHEEGWGSCKSYGCDRFVRSQPCQCNSRCHRYGNCCSNYDKVCGAGRSRTDCYASGGNTYKLDWKAEGKEFFRNWTFVTQDMVHGAQQFVTMEEAREHGVISTTSEDAFLRVSGIRYPSRPGEAYKRFAPHIRSNIAWDPKDSMVVAMKYKHVPQGCGIWPGFWMVNSDELWPKGGELDILEYANDDPSKVSLHVNDHCHLDARKIDRCAPLGHGGSGPLDCYTSYFQNAFGCRPKQKQRTGADYARTPGVIAAEWTKDAVTVFFFPDSEIPADLANNNPKPHEWSAHVIAYLPFQRPCTSIGPQELVLNIQLCGDAAGGPWAHSQCAYKTAMASSLGTCVPGLSQPADCCTQWVTSLSQESYMKNQAYFDVNYVKVFTPTGTGGKHSATFLRGGELLTGL